MYVHVIHLSVRPVLAVAWAEKKTKAIVFEPLILMKDSGIDSKPLHTASSLGNPRNTTFASELCHRADFCVAHLHIRTAISGCKD